MEMIATDGSPAALLTASGEPPNEGAARPEVRVVRSPHLLEQLSRARRETYAAHGVVLHDGALDAQRRYGTTLGVFLGNDLVGAFSAWRLSEALLSLGYMLTGTGVERHPPDKVVELASMFILPAYAGRGYARLLLEAGRILVAGMAPQLIVAFAVRGVVADLYTQRLGFRPVGPFVPHPLAPSVEVVPLVITFEEFAPIHFA